MLLRINGPFGGGKTQVAHELRRRLPGSVICDPEEVGFGLHRMTPRALRGDFQDLPSWRTGVREVLDLVLRQHDGVVIAPMTLIDPVYVHDIVPWLRQRDHDVRHFTLMADRETVLRRLRERGLGHVEQVAEVIAASAGVRLLPGTETALRARARRAWIGVRHTRLG